MNGGKFAARFAQGGKWQRLRPLYEAVDFFLRTPGQVTRGAPHVRDGMDMKRLMITVIIALIPPAVVAFYNTGLQANLALQAMGLPQIPGWRGELLNWLHVGSDPHGLVDNMSLGGLYFLPLYMISVIVGGLWEALFACVRKQDVNEGFLVTSLLFALTLPPDMPWWQTALGISFGVVIGKEIYGGVGMNILNPALVGRCFLFFSYPKAMAGNTVWVAVDGYSRATPLTELADPGLKMALSWQDAFFGWMPGSLGETSTFACLIGAAILLVTQVASWRVMVGVLFGMTSLALLFNLAGSSTNPMFQVTPQWHLVLGGFAFGTVYMATDPVTSAHTLPGQYVYGFLIGALTVLVRVINPGFPEGIMLAILFGNIFAPTIDRFFIDRHIARRRRRQEIDARR